MTVALLFERPGPMTECIDLLGLVWKRVAAPLRGPLTLCCKSEGIMVPEVSLNDTVHAVSV
mgnify:CR=1 FL=1